MDICNHFGFKEIPFTREIQVRHHMRLDFHQEAIESLLQTVTQRMSGAVIAPAGTGKTNVLRALEARLPEARYRVSYIKVTSLSKRDICREIAEAVGTRSAGTYPMLVRLLQEHFSSLADADGMRPVLLIDEAHDLRPDVLGMLRILTNFDMDSRLVISLVLGGQPLLGKMLRRVDLEDIARRLTHYAFLRPLSRQEARRYVDHRCTIAGAKKAPFDKEAYEALYEIGRGNFRATDHLALKALQVACAADCKVADSDHVAEARKSLWP